MSCLIVYPAAKEGTEYTIPDGVVYVYQAAFEGCSNLKSINVPASVISLKVTAFGGCSALENINVAQGNRFYSSIDGVLFEKSGTVLLKYP